MHKIKKLAIFTSIFLMLILPTFSFAAGLVPDCDNLTPTTQCDFTAFMTLIDTVIKFILFNMAVPIAAIMFAYAGFLMVTSGGSTESRTKAKSIFTNAALGLIFAAAAWLIIKTILLILGYKGPWFLTV